MLRLNNDDDDGDDPDDYNDDDELLRQMNEIMKTILQCDGDGRAVVWVIK